MEPLHFLLPVILSGLVRATTETEAPKTETKPDPSTLLCTGMYRCDDGGCVDNSFFCDNKTDCVDGSDEKYCPGNDAFYDYNFDLIFQKRPDADREEEEEICAMDVSLLPKGCKCKEGSRVYCDDLGLPAVPFGIPDETQVLDVSGNQFKTISQRDFDNLHKLEKLVIMHSKLRLVLPGTFQNCKKLKEVYLTGNEIGDLPDDIFPEDNVVEILDLRLNRLRVLTPDYFIRLRHLKKLYLQDNIIETIMPSTFSNMWNLQYLNLDGNNLEKVSVTYFTHLPHLETLRLSRNRIYYTEGSSFLTLNSLTTLDLSSNFIRKLPFDTFTGLWNLSYLDLQQNQIVWIEHGAFSPLVSLVSLNVRKNNFRGVDSGTFEAMPRLQHIYFDTFFMCAYARHVAQCEPGGDGISSRANLLENSILRSSVWVVAVLACAGNMAVLMGRLVMREDNHVHSFLIKNLSLADLLMGVYLFVLATHDLRYRGHYLDRDKEWRDSWGCDICGILTTVSSEASVLILTMITLDRYMCILYPLKMRRRSLTFAYAIMLVVWCTCVALAVLPVLGLQYFGTYFYRNNAVCIPLFLHEPRGDGWEYSAFIFVGINLASFLFIAYAYVTMFLAIRRSRLMIRPADEHQERCLMKRFFFIVVTDLVCWAPIISLKAAALAGVGISGSLYAWVVVFILPVNCALNPLLYTLTTRLFKQRLSEGLAQAMRRRRSLDTHSSSSLSFSSLKTRASSNRSSKDSKDPNELDQLNGNREKTSNIYVGRMKYKYSHGRVIYPPGRVVTLPNGYKVIST